MIKKIMVAGLVALGLNTAIAQPLQDWTTTDKALLGVGTALHVIDWGQTRYIVKHPGQYQELNFMLPDHPSMAQVNAYMLGTLLLFPVMAEYFPEYRTGILSLWIASRALVVGRNYQIGIRMSW